MRYLIQPLLVILFFILPVYTDILLLNMYSYLMLGLQSGFPGPLMTIMAFVAALLLMITSALGSGKTLRYFQLVSLALLLLPVIIVWRHHWQLNSAWSGIAYLFFFILIILCVSFLLETSKVNQ